MLRGRAVQAAVASVLAGALFACEGARPIATAAPTPAPSPAPRAASTFDPSRYIGQGDRYNCADFRSQAEAQAVLPE